MVKAKAAQKSSRIDWMIWRIGQIVIFLCECLAARHRAACWHRNWADTCIMTLPTIIGTRARISVDNITVYSSHAARGLVLQYKKPGLYQ
jgi:hypothetical protein